MDILRNKLNSRPPFNIPVDTKTNILEASLCLGRENREKLKYHSLSSNIDASGASKLRPLK